MLRNLIVASLFVIMFVRPVRSDPITPIPFAFGMSSPITLPANERVVLPGFLRNTGTEPLVFDDLNDFAYGWIAGPGEGTEPLHIVFPVVEFAGVTIPVDGLFTFPFSSILLEPSLSTQLHPSVIFQISLDAIGSEVPIMLASIPLTIGIGPQTEFGPLVFVDAVQQPFSSPIPEPSTLVLVLAGGAVAGLGRIRKRVVHDRAGARGHAKNKS